MSAHTAEQDAQVLGLVAYLLSYPDASWHEELPQARRALAGVEDAKAAGALRRFLDFAESMDAFEFESLYVRSFDFSQNTNLYLTSRGSKDSGQQRMGLLSYQLTFKEMGYETPIETPDYLPAVLKLAATVQPDQMATVLTRAAGDITLLRGAAAESDENLKAYIALIDLVIDIAKAHERTVA